MISVFVLATFALLRWTNPPQPIDSVRVVQVMATGDSIARSLYASTSPLAVKSAGLFGAPDSAYLSVSTANVVGPAAARLVLFTHNGAGWSPPSNALSLFYAARDTFYLGPPLESQAWVRGPGLFGYSQAVGDSRWLTWKHAEVVQDEVRARLCLIYGYACRRGVRDTLWCSAP